MKKVTKSYIAKKYPGFIFANMKISPVKERNPMKVKNDGEMIGFYYYDKDTIIDGNKRHYSNNYNCSKWIIYGDERLNLEEVIKMDAGTGIYDTLIFNMENNNIKYVCKTQVGAFEALEDGDMTFNEYLALKVNNMTLEEYLAQKETEKQAVQVKSKTRKRKKCE